MQKPPEWLMLCRLHSIEMSYTSHFQCCMCVWCYMIVSDGTDVICVSTLGVVNDIYWPSMVLCWCNLRYTQRKKCFSACKTRSGSILSLCVLRIVSAQHHTRPVAIIHYTQCTDTYNISIITHDHVAPYTPATLEVRGIWHFGWVYRTQH